MLHEVYAHGVYAPVVFIDRTQMPKITAWYIIGTQETFADQIGIFFFRGFIGKESACQCRRVMFDPWVRKIP